MVRNLMEEMTPQELQKLKAYKSEGVKVDKEWFVLAEFAIKFGWQAYLDVRDDRISLDEMMTLLEASRQLEHLEQVRMAQASFIGAASANSKKPYRTFKSLIRGITKLVKVEE